MTFPTEKERAWAINRPTKLRSYPHPLVIYSYVASSRTMFFILFPLCPGCYSPGIEFASVHKASRACVCIHGNSLKLQQYKTVRTPWFFFRASVRKTKNKNSSHGTRAIRWASAALALSSDCVLSTPVLLEGAYLHSHG